MWRFSDGTMIELGGKVTGSSDVAEKVRHGFGLTQIEPTRFPLGPQPDSQGVLLLDSAAAIDAWLRYKAPIWGVTVVEAPEIAHPLVDQRDLSRHDPDAVY